VIRHHTHRAGVLLAAAALVSTALSAQGPSSFDRSKAPTLAPPAPLAVPEVRASRLPNGAALKVVEHRELPLVHITLQFAGGGRLDRDNHGLATFVTTMIREGAGARDANTLQSELAYLGASLGASASWDVTEITLRVAKRNLEPALDLMADVVLRPTFNSADVSRQRDQRRASLLQARDQANAVASLAFNQLMFPEGHPYRHALGGDSASTAALDSATVRNFHQGAYRANRATFTVVGDLSAQEATTLIQRRFGNWTASGAERTPAPVLVQPVRTEARRVVLVDKPNAAQSVIMMGVPGVERTSGDFAAIQVMNTILGGSFSSRLNSNLRETKGYTYGASSGFQWRPLPGAFIASSSVRTNVTDSSLVEFFKEMNAIRDVAVSPDELARAKAYIRLGIPGDFESTAQIAGQITGLALFNLPLTWLQEYVTRVDAVTAEDVQRVARRYVPANNATIVVVGDLSKIRAGIEALNLGPVTTLEMSAIFR
jgi:predicted Zn-dependent peptidase